MDFNDIKVRLDRLYATLDARFDLDLEKHTQEQSLSHDDGIMEFQVTFGANSEAENLNAVMNIVHGVAGLKDHLKNKMSSLQKDPQDVERLIDGSPELQLVIDPDNKDKHGDPLTKSNRSGKNPGLGDVQQGLSVGGGRTTYLTDPATGVPFERSRNARIATTATVVDGAGAPITSFDEMIGRAMDEIESFIDREGLG
jgi:hypothetical protein